MIFTPKNIFQRLLVFLMSVLFFINCNNDNKRITEGTIEYDITYPCLERNNNSLMFLLPKKMITTFKDHCYKNEFIFANENSKLEVISLCESENTTLAFGYGKSKKYTQLDSSTIYNLLEELPNYNKYDEKIDTITFLKQPSFSYKIQSDLNDSVYDIITTNAISINNVNWCTPFNKIDEVLLQYDIIQYGIEMNFKATKIKSGKVENDFLDLEKDYNYLDIQQYLKELKVLFSMFQCS